jgi:hypothetical protein
MSQDRWIPTATGGRFYPLAPRVQDVTLYDIAHHLANECRFTGATRWHYSVAQHSVLVSQVCPTLEALLHDSAEAYLKDLPKPIKDSPDFAAYKQIEERVLRTIYSAFNLTWPARPAVKAADNRVVVTEIRDLLVNRNANEIPDAEPLAGPIEKWTPEEARDAFIKRYWRLHYAQPTGWRWFKSAGLIPRLNGAIG